MHALFISSVAGISLTSLEPNPVFVGGTVHITCEAAEANSLILRVNGEATGRIVASQVLSPIARVFVFGPVTLEDDNSVIQCSVAEAVSNTITLTVEGQLQATPCSFSLYI